MPAFLNIASKYFKTIELKGPSLSPDDSKRFIFHLSNPTPKQPEAILIYGPGGSGKSVLSRTYFNHLILRTDDIFFVWKANRIDLMLSVAFFSDILRGKGLEDYLSFCTDQISAWLNSRINRDVVIEGYDLSFDDYRSKVVDLLKVNNWKVKEIQL
jgi:Cdc6-like AAA superfamily ATPase